MSVEALFSEPWFQLFASLVLGLAMWRSLGRYRPFALVMFAAALLVVASFIFPFLSDYEFGWVGQAVVLYAAGTMFASGLLVPVARFWRTQRIVHVPAGPWTPYIGPIVTGLSATIGSLVGLYWLSSVREGADIRASLELAIVGGILTATIGITRADRELESS